MAGKASNPISVNQAPQYGDKTALDNAAKATTTTPMTGNPMPAPGAGRPRSGVYQPQGQPQEAPPPGVAVPDEHKSLMQEFAQAYRTKVFWDNVLKNYPSEWSRLYASDAAREYSRIADELRGSTPFFE